MPTNNTENILTTPIAGDAQPIPSSRVAYDNTISGLEATTVQGAIDELDEKIKSSDEASEITYDNAESGLDATNVQAAIDELSSEKQDKLTNEYYLKSPIAEVKTFKTTLNDVGSAVQTAIGELIATLANTNDYIEINNIDSTDLGFGTLIPIQPYVVGSTASVNQYTQFTSSIASKNADTSNDYLRIRFLSFISPNAGVREYHVGSAFTVTPMTGTTEGNVNIRYLRWYKR